MSQNQAPIPRCPECYGILDLEPGRHYSYADCKQCAASFQIDNTTKIMRDDNGKEYPAKTWLG